MRVSGKVKKKKLNKEPLVFTIDTMGTNSQGRIIVGAHGLLIPTKNINGALVIINRISEECQKRHGFGGDPIVHFINRSLKGI